MSGALFKIIFAIGFILGPDLALAGISKCRSQADKAEKDCQQAADQAKATEGARSADTAAGSGNDINANCDKIGKDIAKQQQNLEQAKGRCANDDGQCDSACNEGDTDAKIEPQMSIERGQISQRKAKCHSTIQPKMAEMAKGLAGLAGNSPQAAACKKESDKGGPPPPAPPMPPPEEKKEKEKKEAMKCESGEGHRYSDCNGVFIAKCTKSMVDSGCSEFAERYCGSATAGGQADVTISGGQKAPPENYANPESLKAQSVSKFKTASVVVDKGGEGLGSGFCRMVSAFKFCQATGRGECPSCRGRNDYSSPVCQNDPSQCIASLSGDQLTAAKNKCPTDPVFLDPAVQKKLIEAETSKKDTVDAGSGKKIQPPVAGGGAPGGGGGGTAGGGAAAAVGGAIEGATPESLPAGTAVGINTGNGGGGGGGTAASGEEAEEEHQPVGLSAQSILPAESVTGMPGDISNQFGPNVFSISSGVYKSMCGKGTLTHCKPKK